MNFRTKIADVMREICFFLLGILVFGACQTEADPGKKVQEIATDGPISNADIIRNPISADQPLDTINVAKLEFVEPSYDFGTVKEGEMVKHTFEFTNTGKAPLIISNAKSTCGCTIPKWPKEPVAPGESGEVEVNFNTSGKKKYQDKPVTISANTHPPQTVIHLKGTVASSEE